MYVINVNKTKNAFDYYVKMPCELFVNFTNRLSVINFSTVEALERQKGKYALP
jgi:hypothetical protein